MNEDIEKLLGCIQRDFDMRTSGTYNDTVDIENVKFLRYFVEKYGWPKKSEHSEKVRNGSWFLIQHGGHDLDLQKHCLNLMIDLSKEGEVDLQHIAYLEDRIRVIEGRAQLYGTQLIEKDGRLVPRLIEDEDFVDDRRADFGLEPMIVYIDSMNRSFRDNN